ncbi:MULTISPECIES: tyrosine-type recombinase/integrase [unclassified Sulfitobacter]|uniref:tyrosine-type recombinase/integrase n=1 Tax=unclassified Sulfitobacter TaxID=196795 RepID=UPI0007C3704D|nr:MULTISPECIES: tyrosine-type recombinase/integrase [unclassified Sulfitobacter]KZY05227.1 hypothetical protein A3721_14950 [Sulfitobacter sp. HI0023]KZY25628.1 hypothetical protein A3728_18385 [Sulfitobacter sp. HI0040]KZZ66526.1 hypothetical protein A3764_16805 [Sulfitobacter sp. HI0129]
MKTGGLPSYIHRRKRDGVLLFRKRVAGRIVEIRLETQFPKGAPIPFALHQERERLLNAPAPVAPGQTVSAVLRHYHAHRKYRDLAPRTRTDYDKRTEYIADKMGGLHPRHIERRHVISWRDAWAEKSGPHEANYRLRVLRLLLEHAIDMGLLAAGANPAKGVSEVRYEKRDRQPWPDTKVAAFRTAFDYGTRERTIFELCLGTGQRIGDVLRMGWPNIEAGGINVRQGKTGKLLWVPLTPHLAKALDALPRSDVAFLTKINGPGRLSYRMAAEAMRAARKAIEAEEYDTHALRYTAAVELCRAGCSDELIAAVTGQSQRMVEHYTRHVRQRVRATEAQKRRR